MGWLTLLIVVVLVLGPLRPWIGRHWALLASVLLGAAFGWIMGALVTGTCSASVPWLPLAWAVVGAIALGRVGPAWLRKIQKDGKE